MAEPASPDPAADPAAGPNAAQAEFWNGPSGETWAREQARLDRAFAPLTAALIARIGARPGEALLDIGCGCGDLSLQLATGVGPKGRVTGIDLSEPMLATARRRAEASPNGGTIAFRRADASAERFEPGFDALVSRFGVMFFDDPPAAFANLLTGLKPGGRLAMMCWQEAPRNGWAFVPMQAIAARFGKPDPTPPHAPGPFAFADRERVLDILRQANFAEVGAESVEAGLPIGVARPGASALDDAVDYAMTIGPVSRYLRERDIPQADAAPVVRDALGPFVRGDTVEMPSACWIFTGRR